MFVSSIEQMKAMDKAAQSVYGISEELLMENAGCAAYEVIRREIGIPGKRFAVICGTGNNGGDALVVARKLFSQGAGLSVFIAGDPGRFKGSALKSYSIAGKSGISCISADKPEMLANSICGFDVVVDGLFGTGLTRNIEGWTLEIVRIINSSGKKVLSLDIPSGINGDTGGVMGEAVRADLTITFGLPKPGNILYPGADYCGRLFVSHISFPPALYANLTTSVNTPPIIPGRNPAGHKGSFGDVLFVAGAPSYYGAPVFASSAFLRAGGGYSRLASPRGVIPFLAASAPETVFIPLDETKAGTLSLRNLDAVCEVAGKCDMVVIGGGLSLDQETAELTRRLVRSIEKPLIIDGDGLSAVAQEPKLLTGRKAPAILTPHPGEMARLTGLSVSQIEAERISVLRETASRLESIIVLKGGHSLIGYPDGRVLVNMSGNSGMATAGSGDVLTGAIAAMFGAGLSVDDAVSTGVFVHGLAGDIAADAIGKDGITASDIRDSLPLAVRRYREKHSELLADSYGKIIEA